MRIGLGLDLSCPLAGNGQAPFAPTDISNLELWLDATDAGTISLRSSTWVTDWADKSGQGNDFSQTVAAEQPAIGTNEVDFAGLLKHLIAGSNYIFSDNDGLSIIALARTPEVAAEARFIFDFGTFIGAGYGLAQTTTRLSAYVPVHYDFIGQSIDALYHRAASVFSFGDATRLYLDNSLKKTDGITTLALNASNISESPTQVDNISGPMTLGKASASDGSGFAFEGALKAILIYTKILSAPELTQLDTYLAALP